MNPISNVPYTPLIQAHFIFKTITQVPVIGKIAAKLLIHSLENNIQEATANKLSEERIKEMSDLMASYKEIDANHRTPLALAILSIVGVTILVSAVASQILLIAGVSLVAGLVIGVLAYKKIEQLPFLEDIITQLRGNPNPQNVMLD